MARQVFGIPVPSPMPTSCDNEVFIFIASKPIFYECTKPFLLIYVLLIIPLVCLLSYPDFFHSSGKIPLTDGYTSSIACAGSLTLSSSLSVETVLHVSRLPSHACE